MLEDSPAKVALCLINKRSRTGDGDVSKALHILRNAGMELKLHYPGDLDEARDAVERKAPMADLVIIGGGDGTISTLAGSLMDAGKPIGVLPLGTANDLARGLAIPTMIEAAADVIVAGKTLPVDVGRINGRPFLNVASIGLSSDIARFHTGDRKRLLGVFSYILSALEAYRRSRILRIKLHVDGAPRKIRCVQFAIGAGRHYGGGLTISEQAEMGDGLLHLYYVAPISIWGWMRLLPALKKGSFQAAQTVTAESVRRIELETINARHAINVDGELVEKTPAIFDILPRALNVYVP